MSSQRCSEPRVEWSELRAGCKVNPASLFRYLPFPCLGRVVFAERLGKEGYGGSYRRVCVGIIICIAHYCGHQPCSML